MSVRGTLAEWWRSVTDVRREELVPAGLMFLYGLLALSSHYVIKPVRNSVFIDRVGAENLPWVYVLTAVVVSVAVMLYSRRVEDTAPGRLLMTTFGLMGASLVGFWAWLRVGGTVASGAFYVFGKVYPLFLMSQFWLVANRLFSTRQAKRLFGPIGVGLVVGGVAGSAVSGLAADLVGSEALLLVAAAILSACALIVSLLLPRLRGGGDARLVDDVSADALTLVRESSHLRTVALILGLTIVVSTLVDWQFNRAVEMYVAGEDAKTAFFGRFFAVQNVASVAIQVFLTSFVLRSFGIGVALLVLPVTLLTATGGVLAVPGLLAAALAKGSDGALRYSLDQSTRELLFLPVPSEVKYRAKPLIDLGIYRGGTGVAGILLLGVTNWLGFGIRGVAVLSILLLVAWIAATVRMRDEFRDSVKRLIGVRDVDLDELIVEQLDATTLEQLRGALASDDEREVLYALSLLEQSPTAELEGELRDLLGHSSGRVRARALSLLYEIGSEEALPEARRLLRDSSHEVRTEAVHFVCDHGPRGPAREMEALLEDDRREVRTAAVGCLLRYGREEQREEGMARVRRLARSERPADREEAAELLSEARRLPPGGEEVLESLVRDPDARVRRRSVRAAGTLDARGLAPDLVRGLEDPETRDAARTGLRSLCPAIHSELASRLGDGDLSAAARERLARVLYEQAEQSTVESLWDALDAVDSHGVRYQILRTLDKIRRDRGELEFEHLDLAPQLRRELRSGFRWALLRDASTGAGPESAGDGEDLLDRTLRQREREAVERALRVLGLRHSLEDLYVAYTALTSDDALDRQRGMELLENALPIEQRRRLAPLVDPDRGPADRERAALERYGIERPSAHGALEELASHPTDSWVRGLARLRRGEIASAARACEGAITAVGDTLLGPGGGRRAEFLADLDEETFVEITERAEILRQTELFADLRTEVLAGLAALMEERSFAEGQEVFAAGELSAELYVVASGAVEARQEDRLAFVAEEGESIGSLSLLDKKPRHYTAVCVEPSRLLVLGQQDFFRLLEEEFGVVEAVLDHLAGEVRRADTS